MLRRKTGMPEERELVMCTITKIQYNSVFASLDEYGKQGMIHISEIAPGRIRNISDYVKEGKVVVCKILRINMERGHIDLSLRRVTEAQRRLKVNGIKQEKLAEKILDFIAKKLKLDMNTVAADIRKAVFEDNEYPTLYSAFEEVVNEDLELATLGIDKTLAKELEDVIRQRIKPPEVHISGKISVISYEPDGVERLKTIIKSAAKAGGAAMKMNYLGGGHFGIDIKEGDYKSAEKILEKVTKTAEGHSSKLTSVEITRK